MLLLLALQSATPPDIELRATVRARSLTIQKSGTAEVRATANDENVVVIEGPKPNGRKRINNPAFNVDIQVRIADPLATQQPPVQPSN
jgi:hypothetical protein